MVVVWTVRFVEHQKALQLAQAGDYNGAPVLRVAADPHPINPFLWQTIVETPQSYQISSADTFNNILANSDQAEIIYKPPTTLATLVAKRSWLGEVYLDWSQYPVVTETGTDPDGLTTVTFRDLRFFYDTPFFSGREKTPLSGTVYVNADRRVVRMEMEGRSQD
jgi:inner membrane protein